MKELPWDENGKGGRGIDYSKTTNNKIKVQEHSGVNYRG